jgi:hypothetical protein
MRVSIVATALDNQGPQIKPVVSMVHRIQNRNTGYTESLNKTLVMNQTALNSTDGATALNMENEIDVNINKEQESTEERELLYDDSNSQVENVSLENVNYLNTMETQDSEEPTFEVDSIELATPELFSSKEEDRSMNVIKNENELFENSSLSKKDENIENSEPEMFDDSDSDSEEDFEIPAFLRKQKN